VYRFFLKTKEILRDFLYPSTLLDVVCCKGALTCNLGLCNSPGLAEEIEKVIKENFIGTRARQGLSIKISGCPNSCGQHPLGLIALQGAVRRVSGRPVPFYKLLLGGKKAFHDTRLAKDTRILLPAKNIPLFLKAFIERLEKETDEKSTIDCCLEVKGEVIAREIAESYAYVPPYSENRAFYYDWGKAQEFSLEGLGPGECGAGVIEMIEADLTDARLSLEKAKELAYSSVEIQKALFYAARALLVVKGSDPKNEEEAFSDFKEKFIREKIAPDKFSDAGKVYQTLQGTLSLGEREKAFTFAGDFLDGIRKIYKTMDSSFNFPKHGAVQPSPEPEKKANHVFDLKGTPCPINYVKVKLFLENIDAGEVIEILLDPGEPIENVPKSLRNDGHQIISIEEVNGSYKVVVKKGEGKGDG
jgi:sulfite reductase (ferredoxin)